MNIFTLQNEPKKRKGTYIIEIVALSFRPFFHVRECTKEKKENSWYVVKIMALSFRPYFEGANREPR
jgi:hypothetical protein